MSNKNIFLTIGDRNTKCTVDLGGPYQKITKRYCKLLHVTAVTGTIIEQQKTNTVTLWGDGKDIAEQICERRLVKGEKWNKQLKYMVQNTGNLNTQQPLCLHAISINKNVYYKHTYQHYHKASNLRYTLWFAAETQSKITTTIQSHTPVTYVSINNELLEEGEPFKDKRLTVINEVLGYIWCTCAMQCAKCNKYIKKTSHTCLVLNAGLEGNCMPQMEYHKTTRPFTTIKTCVIYYDIECKTVLNTMGEEVFEPYMLCFAVVNMPKLKTVPLYEIYGLSEVLRKCLGMATTEKPIILILDALNQLSDTDNAKALYWLPKELPEYVKIIVSTLPELENSLSDTLIEKLRFSLSTKEGNLSTAAVTAICISGSKKLLVTQWV